MHRFFFSGNNGYDLDFKSFSAILLLKNIELREKQLSAFGEQTAANSDEQREARHGQRT